MASREIRQALSSIAQTTVTRRARQRGQLRGTRDQLESRLRDLLDQQAALRELALAVAEMRPPEVIYELVAKEAVEVAGVDSAAVVRFRVDGVGEVVGSWNLGGSRTGSLIPLEGTSGVAVVARTGRSARTPAPEGSAVSARKQETLTSIGSGGSVAVPIRVLQELWGSLLVFARAEEQLPPSLEERLGIFVDLVGLAITNTDASSHLLSQATSDPLTGLLNHRAFQERVESEVGRARRYGRPLALVLLDLDHFKTINDAYGHQAGDSALMQAASLLEVGARAGDVLGRIGGDEFALLLPETTADEALPIAERWAEAFRSAPVGVAAHLTMSAGVCDLTHASGSRELLRLADSALYWAKSQGRDNVVVYSPDTVYELSESDRADRMERLQAFTAVRALARLIDAKDTMSEEHSERVAAFVHRLAEAAGWTPGRVAELSDAALVHDIGKICVPDEVLRKPTALTPAEYDVVKTHAVLGAQMAHDSVNEEQALWIEQHHERCDGTGYPHGLTGTQISEGATLLALADSWDVMTTERSYSPSKPEHQALAECLSLAGTQFSPTACKALEAIL